MELHDHLYALGLRLGREVFEDADGFRGALDDFLDESDASTGDINLLVDAVRLGAFRSMTTNLDSGAEVSRAVEEAGARLARDRGSADVAGSRWACAVLGFAVGRVGESDVRRYRTLAPPPATASRPDPQSDPTRLPQASQPPTYRPPASYQPPSQPPSQPPGSYQPPSQPPSSYQQPPPPQSFSQQPSLSPPSWGSPQRSKRALWPILVAVVAVLAVVGGIVGVVLSNGGDDPAPKRKKEVVSADPNDLEAVNERYAGLGRAVTTGVDSCDSADAGAAEAEKVTCRFADGTLTLTTYDSADALEKARSDAVDLDGAYGGLYLQTGSDVVYGFDASKNDDDDVKQSSIYWDDDHDLQTAVLEGSSGEVPIEDLQRVFTAAGSDLAYPTRPTDGLMIAFINRLSKSSTCERTPSLTVGETEENSCPGPKGIKPYYGKFTTQSQLDDYRTRRAKNTRDSGAEPDTWYKLDAPKKIVGTLDRYVIKAGTKDEQAVIYWDDTDCLCYGEAYLPGGDEDKLYSWWQNTDGQDQEN